jgi:eukaryotic-like serine/threonine-protein kinase
MIKAQKFSHIFIHLAIMAAITTLMLLGFFFWYLPSTTHHGDSITVPDLKGMGIEQLESFLTSRELRFEITADSVYAPEFPKESVVKQYPNPGEKVKRNRKVYLTLNQTTPPSVKMPDLVDVSVKNAQLILMTSGLVLGDIQYRPDLAQNAVLEQWYQGRKIEPGELLQKGAKIDLVVGDGLGNQTFEVPLFLGMNIDEAEFYLVGVGLRKGSVIYQLNDSIPLGTVMRQLPLPGDDIRIGDIVDLWVADDAFGTIKNRRRNNQENQP